MPKVEPTVAVEEKKASETVTEEPKKTEAVTEQPDGKETGEPETGQESSTAKKAGESKTDETPPWMKREISRAKNKERDAEQRATEAKTLADKTQAQLDTALKALETVSGRSAVDAKAKIETEDPRPKRETFDNPDAYDSALIDWSARGAARVASAEATAKAKTEADNKAKEDKKAAEEAEERKQIETTKKAWNERRAKAIEEYPDFAEVTEREDVQISAAMASVIVSAENGPDLAYHLGKNPEVAERIAQLSPALAVFEMGKLAASLAKKPEVSKTPPPAKPLGSRANAGQKSRAELSMDEYAAVRLPEVRAERMGGTGSRPRAN